MLTKIAIVLAVVATEFRPVVSGSQEQQLPGIICQGCRSIVSFATKFNMTQEPNEYKNILKSLCLIYSPPSIDGSTTLCARFVNGFFNIIGSIDPINQCDSIGACRPTEFASSGIVRSAQFGSDIACSDCKETMKYWKSVTRDRERLADLQRNVKRLCHRLNKGQSARSKCLREAGVIQFKIFDAIDKHSPEELCFAFDSCPRKDKAGELTMRMSSSTNLDSSDPDTSGSVDAKHESKPAQTPDVACELCQELVVDLVIRAIHELEPRQVIQQELLEACNSIHPRGTQREECERIVGTNFDELIESIDLPQAERVCQALGACSPSFENRRSLDALMSSGESLARFEPSLVGCIGCKYRIKFVKIFFEAPGTQELIEKWIFPKVCEKKAGNEVTTCKNMVAQFVQALIDSFNEDPRDACEEMNYCQSRRSPIIEDASRTSNRRGEIVLLSGAAGRLSTSESKACFRCIGIISEISGYVDGKQVDRAQKIVKGVCADSGAENKQICSAIRSKFGKKPNFTVPIGSPQRFCTKAMLCEPEYKRSSA